MNPAPAPPPPLSPFRDKWYRALPGSVLLVVVSLGFVLPNFVLPPVAGCAYLCAWVTALAVAVVVLPFDLNEVVGAARRSAIVRWAFVNVVTSTLGLGIALSQLFIPDTYGGADRSAHVDRQFTQTMRMIAQLYLAGRVEPRKDIWERELAVEVGEHACTVRSAGRDGQWGTADDLVVTESR